MSLKANTDVSTTPHQHLLSVTAAADGSPGRDDHVSKSSTYSSTDDHCGCGGGLYLSRNRVGEGTD